MPFGLSRRATVWIAGLIVAANGFFPAVWILLTSLNKECDRRYQSAAAMIAVFDSCFYKRWCKSSLRMASPC